MPHYKKQLIWKPSLQLILIVLGLWHPGNLVPPNKSHVLPKQNSDLQHQIEIIKHLSDSREMVLNTSKNCLSIINFTKNYQFCPLLKIPCCESIFNRVLETKILSYWISIDMKTDRHVQHILRIAYKRIRTIRKLKKAGISNEDILYFYLLKIASVLESNCVAFHSLLTQENSENIERMQKIVVRIIMNKEYLDYHHAFFKHLPRHLPQEETNHAFLFPWNALKMTNTYSS